MPDFYKGVIPIIDVNTDAGKALVNPMGVGSGLVERKISEAPLMGSPPSDLKVLEESEWDAYYDMKEQTRSGLEHMFLRDPNKPAFVNLDQDGDGDCWGYSNGHAEMFWYLLTGVPLSQIPRLNPHFIATYLRRFNGGWCGAGMDVLMRVGCCEEGNGPDQWPLHSHDVRLLTPERLAAAAKHKVLEPVYDIAKPVYGQTMTRKQIATMGLTNIPAPTDYNEMYHSMCQLNWVRIERGSWAPLIINSWKGWGHHGLGVLRGMDADGAVAILRAYQR